MKPNIIYLITHDTGRFLGCYGRPIPFTPNLDRFAARGIQFNHAFCSAPCCGPSRNCAMTGKYSHVTGTIGLGGMGWCLPDEELTIVDYLNDAGYHTAHIGFCHERHYGRMRYQLDGVAGGDERLWKCDSRLVVDNAIEYLRTRDRSRPFYLNLATNETHASHLSGVMTERHGGPVPLDQVWVPPTEPDLPPLRQRFAHWYASLRYFDHHFGRLLAAIEREQLLANTIIVYSTDHGVGCQRGKGHVYEVGVEIALLMHLPGQLRNGDRVDHLIPNIDFLPTLLEGVGLPSPAGINGRSFWPLLAGGEYRPNDAVFIERNFHGERPSRHEGGFVDKYDPQRLVRTREFAYIRHFCPHARPRPWYRHEITGYEELPGREGNMMPPENQSRPAVEFYDLRHDPWEQQNLAGRPEYAAVERDLAARLDQWMRDTNDPALRPEMLPPLQDLAEWPVQGRPVPVVRV